MKNNNDSNLIFKIEEFEGPLDLMLEMFKKNKLEIEEYNLDIVLDQYIEYIRELKQNNYEIAVDYLEMCADIILYKSNKVLKLEQEEEIIDEVLDKHELLERILEYKSFKEVSKKIDVLSDMRNRFLVKDSENLKDYSEQEIEKISLEKFQSITYKFIQRLNKIEEQNKDQVLQTKDYDVNEYIEKLKKKEIINFYEEIETKPRREQVVIFLCILELLRNSYELIEGNEIILLKKID